MKILSNKSVALILTVMLLLPIIACAVPGETAEQSTGSPTAPVTTEPPAPEPTAEPEATQEPKSFVLAADENYIDEVFPLIEAIGAIHNKHYSRENAFFNYRAMIYDPQTGYHLYMRIRFVSDEPGQILEVSAVPDNQGVISFNIRDIHMCDADNYNNEAWIAAYPEELWQEYSDYMDGNETIVITPEDISATGCTAAEGEEYLMAIGSCYQRKLCELFTGMPENYPGYCREMQPVECRIISLDSPDEDIARFYLRFASLPNDLRTIFNWFDTDREESCFADESYPPEIFGWLITHGCIDLYRQKDGSWTGSTSCHDAL